MRVLLSLISYFNIKMSNVEIIDLLDDSQPNEIILLDDDVEDNIAHEVIFKENELFSKLFKMCLNTSNSKGMMRIFYRMIIPAYKEMDKNYSQSERFNKVLNNTIQLFINDPIHKYSHIKGLYEIIKIHRVRKKVEFVTLATNIKGKETERNTKRKFDGVHNNNKKANIDIINLDSYEPSVVIVEKESNVLNDANKTETNKLINQIKSNTSEVLENNDFHPNMLENNQENTLLIPKFDEVFYDQCHQINNELHIIEKKMDKCRKRIAELEEKEVDDDSAASPYILCQKYKGALVELYKKWCTLMGEKSVKSKKIRLKVQEGHPPGPVRRLEIFLNNNVGSDGCPLFPDFSDVVECVLVSNKEDGLSWSKARVMNEATALFTQCGRALQKRRQKREWYYLMSRVKQKECDKDPAEDDPELEARLQENKRMANIKEASILERFSLMQELSSKDKNNDQSSESSAQEHVSDNSICIDDEETGNIADVPKADKDADNKVEVKVKQEPNLDIVKLLDELGDNYTTTVQDIEDPFLVVEISDSSDEE